MLSALRPALKATSVYEHLHRKNSSSNWETNWISRRTMLHQIAGTGSSTASSPPLQGVRFPSPFWRSEVGACSILHINIPTRPTHTKRKKDAQGTSLAFCKDSSAWPSCFCNSSCQEVSENCLATRCKGTGHRSTSTPFLISDLNKLIWIRFADL